MRRAERRVARWSSHRRTDRDMKNAHRLTKDSRSHVWVRGSRLALAASLFIFIGGFCAGGAWGQSQSSPPSSSSSDEKSTPEAQARDEADPNLVVADPTPEAIKAADGEPILEAGGIEDTVPIEGQMGEDVDYSGIEEVMVTAQKRSSSLQETPSAITALSGAQLFDRGIYDVEALATQVPNLQYGETFGVSRITIRGIGSDGFADPSVAFNIDGIYQNNPTAASALSFYDLAQIEVLRGPQGTLWGRNSTAGAINVSTRAPTDEFEIFGDVLTGSYNQVSARGVVNVPIIEERMAMRVAGYMDYRDGFQDNLFYPGTEQDANDAKNWGIRPQVALDITDDLSLNLRGNYNHQGGVGWSNVMIDPYPGEYLFTTSPVDIYVDPFASTKPPGWGPLDTPNLIAPKPSDPRQIYKDTRQFQDIHSWDVNGTLVWNIQDKVEFSVVGSYRSETRAQNFDGDLTEAPMVTANVTASTQDRVVDGHLRSLEPFDLKVAKMEWLVGFFFLDADGELTTGLPGLNGESTIFNACVIQQGACRPSFLILNNEIPLIGSETYGSNYNLSLAPYAHAKFLLFDEALQVSSGLRWNYDKKRGVRRGSEVTTETLFGSACIQPGYPAAGESDSTEESWDSLTGEIVVEYLITDENMAYGKYTHGWKPGYINGSAVGLNCAIPPVALENADPESVNALEIGSKNRFMDNSIQANVTGFYYNYDNLQVASQFDNTGFIQNAAEARTWGVEFEGIWQPTFLDDLSLSVVYGYLNAKYVDYQGFDFTTGIPNTDFSGNQMVRAPEHSATLAADYLWRLPSGFGALIPRIQYTVSSAIYFTAANRPEDEQPWFGKLQVRMRWESDDANLFVEGFADNLTDQDVRSTQSVGSSLLGRPVLGAYEPPRTWGVRIGASY